MGLPCRICGHEHRGVDDACAGCGAPAPGPELVDGRYQIEGELGRGAVGVVYRARDVGLGRSVALKLISPRWLSEPAVIADFHREAQALASIRHENVVQIFAFGAHDGAWFFAMELVRGKSLESILAEHRQHHAFIPIHRALTILVRLAGGLGAVHATGIVHRDVKPGNVLIEEGTGRAVLVDFGLAVPRDDASLATIAGTPSYMAPEQAGIGPRAGVISERTDVYSLGCTAFEMLTGRLPFEVTSYADLLRHLAFRTPPRVSTLRPDLTGFDHVLARALAKDPDDRYSSCAELSAALTAAGDRWLEGDPSVRQRRAPPEAAPRGLRVLVVDDDPAFRRFAARAAQLAFYRKPVRVVLAGSGAEALEQARIESPDLILLDFEMPELDGVDTLSRLRVIPGNSWARVVVVSGTAGPKERWRFSVMGVSDFVSKPVDLQTLVETLTAIADRAQWFAGDGRESEPPSDPSSDA
jgi:serine/threonine-protein kinase